jgi:hypothetical protein
MKPVKIMAIKYECPHYEPYGLMGYVNMYAICMCLLKTKITIYDFEGLYDPKHLNIDPDDPNGWQIFAEKTRDIMAKCLGVPKVQKGYRDKLEFLKILKRYKKALSNGEDVIKAE